MSNLPMAQIPNFQLPGNVTNANLGQGIAQGIQTGEQTGIQLATMKYMQQMRQLQMAQLAQQIHQEQIKGAENFMGSIAKYLDYLPDDQIPLAVSNGLNAVAKAAPEFGIQQSNPSMIDDTTVDKVKQFGDLYRGHMEGKVPDAVYQQSAMRLMSSMSQHQRNIIAQTNSVLGKPTYQPTIGPGGAPGVFNPTTGVNAPAPGTGPSNTNMGPVVPAATAFSQSQQNARESYMQQMQSQRSAAGASVPLFRENLNLNTATAALEKGNQFNDRIAMLEIGKALNGGTMPNQDQLKQLLTAGPLGENATQYVNNAFGTAGLTPDQRQVILDAVGTYQQGLQKTLASQTGMFGSNNAPSFPQFPAKEGPKKLVVNGKTWVNEGKGWQVQK